ncbi:head GIN domain-containing protein [Flavihumibacter stibioxidans]|uniref:Putative auto-transporter adhesin head GIN domain-containing protein n=1 Tax=Flavihumibacter stibioxidans TaxID=1834163 RepID=A0ABR7MCH5_9BACT|nr:head GIN domain-containing protein [Flavihumibacter stibioxidans]MBC6492248.1 hypothetical protein [Flavihumibacter stibioxidans]
MKSANAFLLLFFSGLLILASSCSKINGEGPVVSEERFVTNFSTLHFGTGGNLYYEPSSEFSLEIRAQKNILDVIETYVSNNELKIKIRDNTVIHSHDPITVYLKAPDLEGMYINGSGDIFVQQAISPDRLKLETNGSGKIDLAKVSTGLLETRVNGSGDIIVRNGSATEENCRISGSGDIHLLGLEAETSYTQTSGSGDISLWVNDLLDCQISGSGMVKYKGSPQVKVKISGSGRVVPW